MSQPMARAPQNGDISISVFPGGYLVGRILDLTGPDRMWEHLASTPYVAEAYRIACEQAAGRVVWFCEGPAPLEVDCLSMGIIVGDAGGSER